MSWNKSIRLKTKIAIEFLSLFLFAVYSKKSKKEVSQKRPFLRLFIKLEIKRQIVTMRGFMPQLSGIITSSAISIYSEEV